MHLRLQKSLAKGLAVAVLGLFAAPIQANQGCYFETFWMFGFGASGLYKPKECIELCNQYGTQEDQSGTALAPNQPGRCYQRDGNGSRVFLETYTNPQRCVDGLTVPSLVDEGGPGNPSQADYFNVLKRIVRGFQLYNREALSQWLNINGCNYSANASNNFQLIITILPNSPNGYQPYRMSVTFRRVDQAPAMAPRVLKYEAQVADSNMTPEQIQACRDGIESGCPVGVSMYANTRWAVSGSYSAGSILEQSNLIFHDYQLRELVKRAWENRDVPVSLTSPWSATGEGFSTTGSYFSE